MPSASGTKQVVLEPSTPAAKPSEGESSYGGILKSTAWIGGSSIINIFIGILRTKATAVLLGPSGFGLAGLYMSIVNVAQSAAGMGINSSGVHQIAEAVGSEDNERIWRTVTVLRRTSFALGLIGALSMIALARPISKVTFGSTDYTTGVYIVSAAVFLQLVSAGQGALIQGLRRISDLAKMGVIGSVLGAVATVILIYMLGERGVVPSLVAVAGMSLLVSWWFSRRISIGKGDPRPVHLRREVAALLKLGFAFMISALLMMASAYAIRILVLHKLGLAATGLYQCAWTLGGLYVGMILQAMGADFFPRLTATVHDRSQCNRLVNEQARVSMLLAGPGVVATITFAPLVISLFYGTNFTGAVEVLRWICLGVALRVISWPMGVIIMARGNQRAIIFGDAAWTVVHLVLAGLLVDHYGLSGAGMAFLASYVFHIFLNYFIVHRAYGFRWSSENKADGMLYLLAMAATFCSVYVLPAAWALSLGTVAALIVTAYSFRVLVSLVSTDAVPSQLRTLLALAGVSKAA